MVPKGRNMSGLQDWLLDPGGLTPHGFCLAWQPQLLWLHAGSNLLIALAYYSIPLALMLFVRRRSDLAFPWVFWLFAAFILACGTTHVLRLATIWLPMYWLDGMVMLLTAAISIVTAVMLWPLIPRALALPTPERLAESQKLEAVGQLTAGVAHDFNNILMGLGGALRMLPSFAPDDPRRAAFTEAALKSVERGERLVGQLLAFARRQDLAPSLLDTRALILAEVEDLLARTLGGQVSIETDLEPGLWPVLADRTQLEAAILNLAINGRDAMPDGGLIRILGRNAPAGGTAAPSGLPRGDYVRLAVEDQGIGMPAEVVARAFDPFFTTKPPGAGTGLGLSQVYGFARQSGGTVDVRSAPGKGTSVTIWLPRATAAPGFATPAMERAA
jgi:signal transduction histidine kinase